MNPPVNALNLDAVTQLIKGHGQWLKVAQPEHGLNDLEAMTEAFEKASGHVQNRLQLELLKLAPEIPVSVAEFDPVQQNKAEYPVYWIIDPIDGAVQYLSGLPLWTLTLCLVIEGKPILAWVYDPVADNMYRARAGHGADCNGKRLEVMKRGALELAVIGTSFPNYPQRPQAEIEEFMRYLGRIIPRVFAQRWMGPASLSLAQLAAGKLDGYWETGRSLYDWLPGALIAQEAGALLTGLDGRPFDWSCQGVLAASPTMYSALAGVLYGESIAG